MDRTDSQVKSLRYAGRTAEQIAKQLRIPVARVRTILANLDI